MSDAISRAVAEAADDPRARALAHALRHALNNPLAALMAEVQLLQLDSPSAEVGASAERMLALVQRLADIARALDMGDARPRPSAT